MVPLATATLTSQLSRISPSAKGSPAQLVTRQFGEVAEWSKANDSKSFEGKPSVGSNPTLSVFDSAQRSWSVQTFYLSRFLVGESLA